MSTPRRMTETQMKAAESRRRDGSPDLAAMTNTERQQAGLMTRGQAAEHEHIAAVPYVRPAERVRGFVPDDMWARDDTGLAVWQAWYAAGHNAAGCEGWSQDHRGRVVCACGEIIPVPETAA